LACLKALWTLGEGRVHDVRDFLRPERPLAYTTVMTLLDRLAKRGAVSRRRMGRSFVYVPVATRDRLRTFAVKSLVDDFFDGSADDLRAYLAARPRAAPPAEPENLEPALL
jgi:predicted transcriptional regulator